MTSEQRREEIALCRRMLEHHRRWLADLDRQHGTGVRSTWVAEQQDDHAMRIQGYEARLRELDGQHDAA